MLPDTGGADEARWQTAQAVALLPALTALEAQPEAAVLAAFVFRSTRRRRQRRWLNPQHAVWIAVSCGDYAITRNP